MDLTTRYLRNLAKRVMTDGQVHPKEIANVPRLIDKAYGNGDGQLDLDDLIEVGTRIGSAVVDKVNDIWDIITSL